MDLSQVCVVRPHTSRRRARLDRSKKEGASRAVAGAAPVPTSDLPGYKKGSALSSAFSYSLSQSGGRIGPEVSGSQGQYVLSPSSASFRQSLLPEAAH